MRNPAKAGIVERLNQYKWSSYNLMTKLNVPSWYDNVEVLKIFSEEKILAIKLYKEYISKPLKEYISKPLKEDDKEYPLELFSGIAVGSKNIYEKILNKINKNKRSKDKQYLRKINWRKRIANILDKNNITMDDLRKKNSKKILKSSKKYLIFLKKYII